MMTTVTKIKEETVAQIKERSEEIVEKLASFGIVAATFSRPPVGKNIFMISRDGGQIKIWPGGPDVRIKIRGNKRLRQAVISVIEEDREIRVVRKGSGNTYSYMDDKELEKKYISERWWHTGNWGGPNIPTESTFKVNKFTVLTSEQTGGDTDYGSDRRTLYTYELDVTAKIPASEQFFLIGYDEISQFICQLPEQALSVSQAHDILRPEGVPKNAKRQGEFFFVPAEPEVIEKIRKAEARSQKTGLSDGASWYGLELDSSHEAQRLLGLSSTGTRLFNPTHHWTHSRSSNMTVPAASTAYAKGQIRDRRKGHHETVMLDDWHRVIRNREIVTDNSARYD